MIAALPWWTPRGILVVLAVALHSCAASAPLLFWSGFPPEGFEQSDTIALAFEPPGGNEYSARLRRILEEELSTSCHARLRFVRPHEEADILLDLVEHPPCLGAHLPCRPPSGAYVRARFKVGGEAVLYVHNPRGCQGSECFDRHVGQILADELCRVGLGATIPRP